MMSAQQFADLIRDLPVGIVEVDRFGGMTLLPLDEQGVEKTAARLRRLAAKHGLTFRANRRGFVWKINGLGGAR